MDRDARQYQPIPDETGIILSRSEEVMQPDKMEVGWLMEVVELGQEINDVVDALKAKNSITTKGFNAIHINLIDTLKLQDRLGGKVVDRSLEAFTIDSLRLMSNSVKEYRKLKDRPGRVVNIMGTEVFQYDRVEGCLTPREVRLLIQKHGLNGKELLTNAEIARNENLATVNASILRAEYNLALILSPVETS